MGPLSPTVASAPHGTEGVPREAELQASPRQTTWNSFSGAVPWVLTGWLVKGLPPRVLRVIPRAPSPLQAQRWEQQGNSSDCLAVHTVHFLLFLKDCQVQKKGGLFLYFYFLLCDSC